MIVAISLWLAQHSMIRQRSVRCMGWQPLAFFSRKLSPAQQKYSAYDRKLLAIYEAVRHFRHMLKAHHFTILMDHKPWTFAFQQKKDKCSPRQFNHLDYISQFTTDIHHISGQDNIIADTFSHVQTTTTTSNSAAQPFMAPAAQRMPPTRALRTTRSGRSVHFPSCFDTWAPLYGGWCGSIPTTAKCPFHAPV